MTDNEFEKQVADLMRTEPMPEEEARARVALQAGLGTDLVVDDETPRDPLAVIAALGNTWKPLP